MSGLPTPKLPFWMAGPELAKLGFAAKEWFRRLGEWSVLPARQMDPMTASLPVLRLLAHQRCITAYPGEPERLFRLRVRHAYANAKDAGLVSGWKRIFERLELGDMELEERQPGQDWDIVGIVADDATFPDQQNVLEIIIDEYGRTCRRYRFISRITQPVAVRCGLFDDDHCTVCAEPNPAVVAQSAILAGIFDSDHATMEAHA